MLRSGAYAPASSVCADESGTGASRADQLRDHDAFLAAEYYPTDEECQQLSAPIADFLSRCSCYDMLGTSTQVVALNVDVTLKVAFIAAQESRLNVCALWDPVARSFCGVMNSTDYIEILLYCNDHPDEASRVSQYTIRQWREKRRSPAPKTSKSSPPALPAVAPFVTCTTEMSLSNCLQKIYRAQARCIVVVAEKEAQDPAAVAVIDFEKILVYLGAVFLSVEAAGDGRRRRGSSVGGGGGGGGARGSRGSLLSASTVGAMGGDDDDNNNNNNNNNNGANFSMTSDDVTLPLHVRNLLHASADGESSNPLMDYGKEPRVGPYRAIVDVPFCYVPALGRHRGRAISVTMDTPLLVALRLMVQHGIEAIAVVSEEQIIVDVIERCDVVRIEDQGVYDIKMPVREALGSKVSGKTCVFHSIDSLRDIFIHFVRRRVKELFLVDPDTDKLIGQLNVAEIVVFLVFGITTAGEQPQQTEK